MKFIYFTDIHLCEGRDSSKGFERCLDSMLSHGPQLLINGGDLGITPETLSLYDELSEEVPVPILHSNGCGTGIPAGTRWGCVTAFLETAGHCESRKGL